MNGYECNTVKDGMFYSTRPGKLNRTFHLSPNEKICTIARLKNIHYLFNITSINICCRLERLINLNILENAILF